MGTLCGTQACDSCEQRQACGGCERTGGRPFGGRCAAAELVKREGPQALARERAALLEEINALGLEGLHAEELYLLNGFRINLEYELADGRREKLLEDDAVYWGTQICRPGGQRYYGVASDGEHLLVSEYGPGGERPRLLLWRPRARKG